MLPSCSTNGTDVKRDCPLLGDAGMKLIEILRINVKLIEEVESYSFFPMNQRETLQTQLPSEICTWKGIVSHIVLNIKKHANRDSHIISSLILQSFFLKKYVA